jgi:hypothetical protein
VLLSCSILSLESPHERCWPIAVALRNAALLRYWATSPALANMSATSLLLSAFAEPNGLALTPPMGWNPYNHFSGNYNESIVRAHADLIVKLGLRDLGYEYVNLDAKCALAPDNDIGAMRRASVELCGVPRLTIVKMQIVAAQVGHKAALCRRHPRARRHKISWHRRRQPRSVHPRPRSQVWHLRRHGHARLRWLARQSWTRNSRRGHVRILGSRLSQIRCIWPRCRARWLAPTLVFATAALTTLADLSPQNCNVPTDAPSARARYTAMSHALNSTGRPILFAMCEWGAEDPATWGAPVANAWRTTGDISDAWWAMVELADLTAQWFDHAGPGGWNDPSATGGRTQARSSTYWYWCCCANVPWSSSARAGICSR